MGLSRIETATGPVAIVGRTINLVARTTTLTLGTSGHTVSTWARPHHVEILDADGRRVLAPVHDYQSVACGVIALVALACAARSVLARSAR